MNTFGLFNDTETLEERVIKVKKNKKTLVELVKTIKKREPNLTTSFPATLKRIVDNSPNMAKKTFENIMKNMTGLNIVCSGKEKMKKHRCKSCGVTDEVYEFYEGPGAKDDGYCSEICSVDKENFTEFVNFQGIYNPFF